MHCRVPSLLLVWILVLGLPALAAADSQPLGWHSRQIQQGTPPDVHMTITELCTEASTCSMQVRQTTLVNTAEGDLPDYAVIVKLMKRPQDTQAVLIVAWTSEGPQGRHTPRILLGAIADGTTVVTTISRPMVDTIRPEGFAMHVPVTVTYIGADLAPVTFTETLDLQFPAGVTSLSAPHRLVLKAIPPAGAQPFAAAFQLMGAPETFDENPLGRRSASTTHMVVGPMLDFTITPIP